MIIAYGGIEPLFDDAIRYAEHDILFLPAALEGF